MEKTVKGFIQLPVLGIIMSLSIELAEHLDVVQACVRICPLTY
jgi:hypothetical protein